MANVSGNTNLSVIFNQVKTSGLPGTQGINVTTNWTFGPQSWTNGVAAGQVDLLYYAKLTLAAAAQTIDLTTILDPFGGTDAFVKNRVLVFYNTSSTDGQTISVTQGVSNGWTAWLAASSTMTLFPSGLTYATAPLISGMTVDSTHKTLKFDPGANTIGLEIGLVGTDA